MSALSHRAVVHRSIVSAVGLPWVCFRYARVLPGVCLDSALGLPWVCLALALGLQWVCTGSALALPWVFLESALGLLWVPLGSSFVSMFTKMKLSGFLKGFF